MNLDYLTNHKEESTEDSLQKIVALSQQFLEAKDELALAEYQAKQAKKRFNTLSMELIPDALMNAGVTSFELTDGSKISYKEEVSTSVKDIERLTKFLEERGDDDIVKTTINVGKLPQNIVNKIMKDFGDKYGLVPEIKSSVHHKTLSSYISTLCGIKKGSEAQLAIGELDPEMINAYTFYKTVVK